MIIFLYGEDDYRRSEKKRAIVEEFKRKHSSLGVGVFDLEERSSLESLEGFLRGQSIFETHKIAVLEGGTGEGGEPLKNVLLRFLEDKTSTVLLSQGEKPLKAFGFLLEAPVLKEEFPKLQGYDWELFLKKEARKHNVNFKEDAFSFIAESYVGDSWRVVTELEKLSALSKPEISIRDLEKLDIELRPNYWATMQAMKGADPKGRLTSFERLIAQNEPAAKIFNILSAMWTEKLPAFAEYDLAVKSGKLEYEEALLDVVLS